MFGVCCCVVSDLQLRLTSIVMQQAQFSDQHNPGSSRGAEPEPCQCPMNYNTATWVGHGMQVSHGMSIYGHLSVDTCRVGGRLRVYHRRTYLLLHALTTDTELYLWPWRSLGSDQSGIGTERNIAVPTPASWRLVKVIILTGIYLISLSQFKQILIFSLKV